MWEGLEASWETIQILMYARIGEHVRSEVSAKIVLEGEVQANEGWTGDSGRF